MNSRIKLARLLVTLPALLLVIVPPLVDLNESHVFNPLWVGHARLHTVWLISSNALIALAALWWMWKDGGQPQREAVGFAALLVGSILAGFFVAGATQSLYGGSFTDPNGVAMKIGPFDANVFAFGIYALLVLTGGVLARRSP